MTQSETKMSDNLYNNERNENNMDYIMVYFKNHKVVKFQKDQVVFADPFNDNLDSYIDNGKAVVNWDNVSFVRKWDPKPTDELNSAD